MSTIIEARDKLGDKPTGRTCFSQPDNIANANRGLTIFPAVENFLQCMCLRNLVGSI